MVGFSFDVVVFSRSSQWFCSTALRLLRLIRGLSPTQLSINYPKSMWWKSSHRPSWSQTLTIMGSRALMALAFLP